MELQFIIVAMKPEPTSLNTGASGSAEFGPSEWRGQTVLVRALPTNDQFWCIVASIIAASMPN
jgi:hypothetical protein